LLVYADFLAILTNVHQLLQVRHQWNLLNKSSCHIGKILFKASWCFIFQQVNQFSSEITYKSVELDVWYTTDICPNVIVNCLLDHYLVRTL